MSPRIAKAMGCDDVLARVLATVASSLEMLRGNVAAHRLQAVVADAALLATSSTPQRLKMSSPHWGTPKD
jgi:hypothetical protein